jgi:hypothetical protein
MQRNKVFYIGRNLKRVGCAGTYVGFTRGFIRTPASKGKWAKGEPVLDPSPTHGPESQRICIAFAGPESLGDPTGKSMVQLIIPQNSRPAAVNSLAYVCQHVEDDEG